MTRLYVTEPGSRVSKEGGHIVVSRENEKLCEVPSETLEGVTVTDRVQVTSSAISIFLAKKIPVTWLCSGGKYCGRLESMQSQDVLRLKEQFDICDDKDFCLQLAKKTVDCKIHNQRTILRNYNRRSQIEKVDSIYKKIKILSEKICGADSVKAVMGYEGSVARLYFQALGLVLPEEFFFAKRTRKPPRDKFNAMLSLGYTLLLNDFYTAIQNAGLHPYVGFLHVLRNGHPALASDLMEPWRPVVVDALCLSLIAHKIISSDLFEETERGVFFSRDGRKTFIKEYERKIESVNAYFGGKYSWRHTIQMVCDSYKTVIHQKNIDALKLLEIR